MKMSLSFFSLISICSCILIGCNPLATGTEKMLSNWNENYLSTLPSQDALFDTLLHKPSLVFICDDEDSISIHAIERFILQAPNRMKEMKFELKKFSQINDEVLKTSAIFLIGNYTFFQKIIDKNTANKLPFLFDENSFAFYDSTYVDKNDVLKISFIPNPFNTHLPFYCIYGNSSEALQNYFNASEKTSSLFSFWGGWDFQIFNNSNRKVIGNFSDEPQSKWKISDTQFWKFDIEGTLIAESEKFKFITHQIVLSGNEKDSLLHYYTQEFARAEYEMGSAIKKQITIHFYPSTELKGLMLNNTNQVHIDYSTNEIFVVYNNEFKDIGQALELQLLARQIFGEPKVKALETGISLLHAEKWGKYGCEYWASKLLHANAFPTLSEIIDNTYFQEASPYFMQCASQLFVKFLNKKLGPDAFHHVYAELDTKTLQTYSSEWNKFLETFKQIQTNEILLKQDLTLPVQGFNFAHEGYSIYNGYAGSSASKSIEQMAKIHVNGISLIPYSSVDDLHKPQPFRFMNGAGGENDEAVIHSLSEAKKNNMSVMLKPQIWTHLGWVGNISMTNETDWSLFFEYYNEFIMHYAMLSEIFNADILCVGVEFQDATKNHEQEWIKIFNNVRQIYSGKITYAANWGQEFESLSFWKYLDIMSMNCYYPLSNKKDASDLELKDGFESILNKLESYQKKFNKPFFITEIGYKSIQYPWIEPHADNDEQEVNEVSQQRCYEAMFQALEDEHWISGIYLWQWPSYMSYKNHNPKGFTPCGKLAEQTVKNYYSKNILH